MKLYYRASSSVTRQTFTSADTSTSRKCVSGPKTIRMPSLRSRSAAKNQNLVCNRIRLLDRSVLLWRRWWNLRDGGHRALSGQVETILLAEDSSKSFNRRECLVVSPVGSATPLCQYLSGLPGGKFAGRLISRWGAFEWPPYSPDRNLCNIFLWRYLKDRVYRDPGLKTLDQLEQKNVREVWRIESALIGQVTSSVELRARDVIDAPGAWKEQLRNY